MKTTLGLLVSELFDMFEQRYRDPELAALATEVIVNDLLYRPRRRLAVDARPRAARSRAAVQHQHRTAA